MPAESRRSRRPPGRLSRRALRRLRRIRVLNASMYPLLHPGDEVLVDRRAFALRPPRRGEIALVESAALPAPLLLKLVVGLPGERVEVAGDRLWIDGRPLSFPQPVVGSLPGRWTLGPSEYFLLSYALATGTDSRHFGPVPRRALRGRAFQVLAPPARRRPLKRLTLDPAG
jgi:signal peptidase I